jgi:hypothetical protein
MFADLAPSAELNDARRRPAILDSRKSSLYNRALAKGPFGGFV